MYSPHLPQSGGVWRDNLDKSRLAQRILEIRFGRPVHGTISLGTESNPASMDIDVRHAKNRAFPPSGQVMLIRMVKKTLKKDN
ncbi:hypothetical protein [Roseovarius spongiae]|uniref:hypothetical protein n=1 Tax=Roseovarius spongiae TaxID=2320272 RepID=UPI00140C0564|nr:hypothetical protein [Roseovarius spongiae]